MENMRNLIELEYSENGQCLRRILPHLANDPILAEENIAGFVEYLAERTGAPFLLIEETADLTSPLSVPAGALILLPHGMQHLRGSPDKAQTLVEQMQAAQLVVLVDEVDIAQDTAQIWQLAQRLSLPLEFVGYTQDIYGKSRLVSILSPARPQPPALPTDDFRAVAIISTFNEIDIIEPVIQHLAHNEIDIYLIDNWSTDGTYEFIQQTHHPRVIGLERWPKSGPADIFEWSGILNRKVELSHEIHADWYLHHDADEIREAPWQNLSLRRAIYHADQLGYNAIDFTVLDFHPTDNGYPAGSPPQDYFRYFKFGVQPSDFLQVKAWKATHVPVDLVRTGGHIAEFQGLKVFPYKFLLKHYPIRSQAHGENKVVKERKDRWSSAERSMGWHSQYDALDLNANYLKNPHGMIEFGSNFHEDFLLERLSGVGILKTVQKDQQIALLKAGISEQEQANFRLADELSGAKNEISRLTHELSDAKDAISMLSSQVVNLEEEAAAYAASTSWQITRPLRKLRKLSGKR